MPPLASVSIASNSAACTNSFFVTFPSRLKSIASHRRCTCASVTLGFSLLIAARSSSIVMSPLLSVSIAANSAACTHSFRDTFPSRLKSSSAHRRCTSASVTFLSSRFMAARSSSRLMPPLASVSIASNSAACANANAAAWAHCICEIGFFDVGEVVSRISSLASVFRPSTLSFFDVVPARSCRMFAVCSLPDLFVLVVGRCWRSS